MNHGNLRVGLVGEGHMKAVLSLDVAQLHPPLERVKTRPSGDPKRCKYATTELPWELSL
jgi:hypothetical protein